MGLKSLFFGFYLQFFNKFSTLFKHFCPNWLSILFVRIFGLTVHLNHDFGNKYITIIQTYGCIFLFKIYIS
jgi:hypothetical protein